MPIGPARLAGSSPRMRGKLARLPHCPGQLRFIPACAGKTCRSEWHRVSKSAHPRVCGENDGRLAPHLIQRGSSPRVRGKPARAARTALRSAHPRVCGENDVHAEASVRFEGSSPRVRGKQHHRRDLLARRRLIPACAGKTAPPRPAAAASPAHPRVCGENVGRGVERDRPRGSSPRVRGKPCSRTCRPRRARLIPACAGKTHGPLRVVRPG
mgnify:CR=1 FL=1